MYDDFDDLLPRRTTASIPPPDNPFGDVFTSSTVGRSSSPDPWGTPFGQSSTAGGFGDDDWNTNAFADHASPFSTTPANYEQESASANATPVREEPPTPTQEEPPVLKKEPSPLVTPVATPSVFTDSISTQDPLDAANVVLEEEEHVPVFKRKLPLLSSSSISTPVTEVPVPDSQKVVSETSTPQTEVPPEVPSPTVAPSTPPAKEPVEEPAQAEESKPEPVPASEQETTPPPPASLSPTPGTPPSSRGSGFSLRNDAISEVPSEASTNVIVSPLETPSRSPVVSRNISTVAEGWAWGSDPFANNYVPPSSSATLEPHSEPETQQAEDEQTQTMKPTEEEEDPADNIPLAQTLKPKGVFRITVGDPQKIGDPISAHIVYTVHTKTTSPKYRKSEFSVLRRYSDFLWLYETLCSNNPGIIVPPVPEKGSGLGLNRFDGTFVEARRNALNKCIERIANHPMLSQDDDLKLFLESDTFALDIKHKREEGGGFLSSWGTSLAVSKFYETDDWFDTKKAYLDGLESQIKGLSKAMEAVAKQRVESSVALGEFADAVEGLSGTDISAQLANTLANLAAVQRRAKKLQDDQAQQDVITFAGTVEEYGRMIQSVRVAFGSRIKCYGIWQTAEDQARRVKAAQDKAKRQGKIPQDRIQFYMQEVAEAERKANYSKHEFERVTQLLKVEMRRFDMERVEDFKKSLEALLEGMIMRQRQLLKAWEAYQDMLLQKAGTNPQPRVTNAEENGAMMQESEHEDEPTQVPV